jgi:hypothetical protein
MRKLEINGMMPIDCGEMDWIVLAYNRALGRIVMMTVMNHLEFSLLRHNALLCLQSAFTLVSCSAYSSILKMEAKCSSETSVDFQRTTRRRIPEGRTLHNHRYANLKSYMDHLVP